MRYCQHRLTLVGGSWGSKMEPSTDQSKPPEPRYLRFLYEVLYKAIVQRLKRPGELPLVGESHLIVGVKLFQARIQQRARKAFTSSLQANQDKQAILNLCRELYERPLPANYRPLSTENPSTLDLSKPSKDLHYTLEFIHAGIQE